MNNSRLGDLMRLRPKDAEKQILEALRRANGSKEKAAELLGVTRSTLWKIMKPRKDFYDKKALAARLGEL